LKYFRNTDFFAVNVLTQQQRDLSISFAVKPECRFEEIDWRPGCTGAPLLSGALAFFECRTSQVIELADHAIFIGDVLCAERSAGHPLLYFDSNYRTLV
jgi:flavin reductase (DIM6/NTAB) family NADH-FMN oxidoreductase RutF